MTSSKIAGLPERLKAVQRRSSNGLSLRSQIGHAAGRASRPPMFAGVPLESPDAFTAWAMAYSISDGEYQHPGLEPEPGYTVIDIGANIGVFSLWAAAKGAEVAAYEPSVETFEALRANVASYSAVRPVHGAVVGQATPTGTVDLFMHPERSTRNSVSASEIETGVPLDGRVVSVPAIPIDSVIPGSVDLLKVDCEGAEFDLFSSISDAALSRVRRVVLEFHRRAGDPADLVRRLEDGGFEVRFLSGTDEAEPFGVLGATRA